MVLTENDANWGTVRSLIENNQPYAWKKIWFILDCWTSDEERDNELLPYCLQHITNRPELSQKVLVEYNEWFLRRLQKAMISESKQKYEVALDEYKDCLKLKSDCLPAAISIHRLKGRSVELLEYCASHPWNQIKGYGSGDEFFNLIEKLIENDDSELKEPITDWKVSNKIDLVEYINYMTLQDQGDAYQTTFEAIPFLIEILSRKRSEPYAERIAMLLLFFGFYAFDRVIRDNIPLDNYFYSDAELKVPQQLHCPFFDLNLVRRDPSKRYTMGRLWSLLHSIASRESIRLLKSEHVYLQERLPTYFLVDKPALEGDRDMWWCDAHLIQVVASGLPVYINIYHSTASIKMKRLVHELIKICGPYGESILYKCNE